MNRKIKAKKNNRLLAKVGEDQQMKKNKTLIFAGVILSISSLGLLTFVLSVKVFHLS